MQFFTITLAALAATVSAMSYAAEECPSTVTVTVTEYPHAPTAPGTAAPSIPPYPTSEAPYPSVPAPTGTGGYPAPTGTGVYTPSPPEYTGAAGKMQVGGVLAGVGAVAALFL